MELTFIKEKRKLMVKAIEEITGEKAKYLGVPSCAYEIGGYRIEKDGTLKWEDFLDADPAHAEQSSRIIDACIEATGFRPENLPEIEKTEETAEPVDLTVEIPAEKVWEQNLEKILEAKGNLIRKALGIDDLRFEVTDEKISFPWFHDIDPHKAPAYSNFISALCDMSMNQKRVTAKEKETENEKYAFRCFLLRLGFIGKEYKDDRKILLENLEGSSAFKSGKKGGDEE